MGIAEVTGFSGEPIAVDLFCGAGGLSYGLQQAGVDVVAGIDSDPDCKHPFEANINAEFCNLDIVDVSPEFVGSRWAEGRPRVLTGCAPMPAVLNVHQRSAEPWRAVAAARRVRPAG